MTPRIRKSMQLGFGVLCATPILWMPIAIIFSDPEAEAKAIAKDNAVATAWMASEGYDTRSLQPSNFDIWGGQDGLRYPCRGRERKAIVWISKGSEPNTAIICLPHDGGEPRLVKIEKDR